MKRSVVFIFGYVLAACGATESGVECGSGTKQVGNQCVNDSSSAGGAGDSGGETSSSGTSGIGGDADPGAGAGGESTPGGAASGGTSGGVCPDPQPIDEADAFVEDFESSISGWMVYEDGTGTVEGTAYMEGPTESNEGELNDGASAAHVHGTGFTGYGVHLTFWNWSSACVDLTAFEGLHFWAKGGPGTETTLRDILHVEVLLPSVLGPEAGGDCVVDCYDNYFTTVTLTEEWTEYSVLWSDFGQAGWGAKVPFTLNKVQALQFTTQGTTAGADFDWWLDDIELVP
jgi:hypothetical protein